MNEFTTPLQINNSLFINQKYVFRKMAIFLLEIALTIFTAYTFLGLFNVQLSNVTELFLSALVVLLSSLSLCCIISIIPFKIKCLYLISLGCFCISYLSHFSGLTYLLNTFFTINILLLLIYVHPPKYLWVTTFLVLSVFVILVILFAPQYRHEDETSKFLNLNTNTSGYILFLFFFITIYYACDFKLGTVKGSIFYLLSVGIFFAQLRYAGRSAMLGDVFTLICILLKKHIGKMSNAKVKNYIFALSVFSLLFTYLYAVTLFNAVGHGKWFFMGKDIFTGRQTIWNDSFDQLRGHVILGLGNKLRSMAINGDTSGFTNVHNQMLGYVVTFGLIGSIPFLFLFSNVISLYAKRSVMMISFILILSCMAYFDTIIYSTDNVKYNCLALIAIAGLSQTKNYLPRQKFSSLCSI